MMIVVSSILAIVMAVIVMAVRIKSSENRLRPKNYTASDFYEHRCSHVLISGVPRNRC